MVLDGKSSQEYQANAGVPQGSILRGSYIISIAKTASKKIGALIRSMNFLSPEVALYHYKSTIRSCMDYCFHVWAGVHSCYLELLDKVQKPS